MTIDASQNVLVGTSSNFGSGTYGLRVSNTAANGFGTLSLQGNRTVAEDTIGLVQAFNSSTEVTRIGSIQGTNATSGQIVFSTASTGTLAERMRINSTGALVLAGGAVSATGIGITFPASQSASTDANTLDDYEEGTWTPGASSQTGSITSVVTQGTYTKIGRVVTVTLDISITNPGTAGGFLTFSGLPFITLSAGSRRPGNNVAREDAATGFYYGLYTNSGATTGSITSFTFGGVVWGTNYTYSSTFTYETDN
jgi:hypothetical protein